MAWTVAIGVDTHKEAHVAVALDVLGVELDQCVFEATLAGYRRLLRWAALLGEPAFAVEGCGSYGAGLARFLAVDRTIWCGSASGPAAAIASAARTTSSTPPSRPVVCSRAAV